jgi:hypothetical protein
LIDMPQIRRVVDVGAKSQNDKYLRMDRVYIYKMTLNLTQF